MAGESGARENAINARAEAARKKWMDAELDAVLREPKSKFSAAQFIVEGRGL
ncbi:MAG: hypothetical protein M3463_00925 [Verrucomicrobiota bacterium]|nr:hypothetical protein [Verrucomicrobiota bacterium]